MYVCSYANPFEMTYSVIMRAFKTNYITKVKQNKNK